MSIVLAGVDHPARAAEPAPVLVTVADDVHVRVQPSRVAATVLAVDKGEPLEVLKRRGKWVKVRVRGAIGWVQRAEVGPPRPAPARKSTAAVDAAPAAKTGRPAAKVARRQPGDDGRAAWRSGMMTDGTGSDVAGAGADAAAAAPDPDDPDDAGRPDRSVVARPPARPRTLSIGVGLGISGLTGRFDSNGSTPLAHYSYGLDAVGAAVLARGLHGFGRHVVVGGDAGFLELRSLPGIAYVGADGAEDEIPITLRSTSLGVFAGWRDGTTMVAGRLGWDFLFVDVGDLMNLPGLPREERQAATVGLRLDQAEFLDAFLLRAAVDAQVLGSVAQTSGREDGTDADSFGARLGLAAVWHSGSFDFGVDYRYTWTRTGFTGASSRLPDASDSERTERQHDLLFFVAVGR